jgi:hypothetical protein
MADTVPNIPADNTETAPVDTIAPDAGDQPGVQAAPADAEAQAAKGSLATDTQAGYANAAAASKGQDSVTVDVFLRQKGTEPQQVGDFVAQMNQKYPGASKSVPDWTQELETFLGRKIA